VCRPHNSASSLLADRCTLITDFRFLSMTSPFYSLRAHRPDDKTARDFNITAGAVLHLVLALRGGR
jgi:hypothetical protein